MASELLIDLRNIIEWAKHRLVTFNLKKQNILVSLVKSTVPCTILNGNQTIMEVRFISI